MTLKGRAKLQRMIVDLERVLDGLRALDAMEGALARVMTRNTPAKKAAKKNRKVRVAKAKKRVVRKAAKKRAAKTVAKAKLAGGRKSARKAKLRPQRQKNVTTSKASKWTKTTAREENLRARYAKAPAL